MPPSLRCLDTKIAKDHFGMESSDAWLPYMLCSRIPVVVLSIKS